MPVFVIESFVPIPGVCAIIRGPLAFGVTPARGRTSFPEAFALALQMPSPNRDVGGEIVISRDSRFGITVSGVRIGRGMRILDRAEFC